MPLGASHASHTRFLTNSRDFFCRRPPSGRRFPFTSQELTPMRILFINNDGGGFADHIEVANGTTVQQLFDQRVPSAKSSNYLIRVNRQAVPREQVLQEGDRISITPIKIEGA